MADIGTTTSPATPVYDPALDIDHDITIEYIDDYRGDVAQYIRDHGHAWLADEVAGLHEDDIANLGEYHDWLVSAAGNELIEHNVTREEE